MGGLDSRRIREVGAKEWERKGGDRAINVQASTLALVLGGYLSSSFGECWNGST